MCFSIVPECCSRRRQTRPPRCALLLLGYTAALHLATSVGKRLSKTVIKPYLGAWVFLQITLRIWDELVKVFSILGHGQSRSSNWNTRGNYLLI